MTQLTLKDLAVDHDYYAHGSNYFSNEATENYASWKDFFEQYNDADIDMNLVYRWDIEIVESSNSFPSPPVGYRMQITQIRQRKGIYAPIHIERVEESDVPEIIAYLKPHFEKLKSIWNPFQ